jgi:hypothetical protein
LGGCLSHSCSSVKQDAALNGQWADRIGGHLQMGGLT